jgi:hypothetical protein
MEYPTDPYKTDTKLQENGREKKHFSVRNLKSNFEQKHMYTPRQERIAHSCYKLCHNTFRSVSSILLDIISQNINFPYC